MATFVFRASLGKRNQRGTEPIVRVGVEEIIGVREHDDQTREVHSRGVGTLSFSTLAAWEDFRRALLVVKTSGMHTFDVEVS